MAPGGAGTRSGVLEHWKLRSDLGEAMPTAKTMVMLYGSGGHHETVSYSLIVHREADGRWRGSSVGARRSWIVDDKPVPMPKDEWVMSVARAKQLEAALARRCVARPAAPPGWGEPPEIGELGQQIDIVEGGKVVATFPASGDGGAIAALVRPE